MRARREELELTRLALARRAGISLSYAKALELGPPMPRRPSDRIARDIARALGCSVDDLSHPHPSLTETPLEIPA
jgi:transcriptional regulator with XRE-family HTH domain